MRIAALVKQIPAFEEMELDADGRLVRTGRDLEMNPYCRRAVAQAVELAAAVGDGTVTVFTLGPPSADDTLREAIAWGIANDVHTEGVLLTDPRFAGSDTLATARALAAALEREGPFDLVLVGRNSVDADTGQVGPELAELLDLPFATGVRYLSMQRDRLHLRCEHDDGWVQLQVALPAIVSAAERLIDPCKVGPDERAVVPAEPHSDPGRRRPRVGPVGGCRKPHPGRRRPDPHGAPRPHRARRRDRRPSARGDRAPPAARGDRHTRATRSTAAPVAVAPSRGVAGPAIGVVVERGRPHLTRELLGAAAEHAAVIAGHVVAVTEESDTDAFAAWGADAVVRLDGDLAEEDVAAAVIEWARANAPWSILAPSTAWGREVASRAAAAAGRRPRR